MTSFLIKKLERGVALSEDDRAVLQRLASDVSHVAAQQDLIREGDRPNDVRLITRGFACRYKIQKDGRRRIMALLLPGDFCDLHVAILGQMDHSIATLTDCEVVNISRAKVEDLTLNRLAITKALWWATLVDESILRHWLANMGYRQAEQQLAHLFCELYVRLGTVGLAQGNTMDLPLFQRDLADILGLSAVHVNRSLQSLRSRGLITLRGKVLTIKDWDRLVAFAEFSPLYLHLRHRD